MFIPKIKRIRLKMKILSLKNKKFAVFLIKYLFVVCNSPINRFMF